MIKYGYNYLDEHHDQLRATAREWRAPALWELLPGPVSSVKDSLTIQPPSAPAYAGLRTFLHAVEVLYWMHGTPEVVQPGVFRTHVESFDRYAANDPTHGGGHTLWAMLKAFKKFGVQSIDGKKLNPRATHYHLGYPDAVIEFLHAGMGPVLIALPKIQGEEEPGVYLACIVSYSGRNVQYFASGFVDGFSELDVDDLTDELTSIMLPSYGLSMHSEPTLEG